MGGQSSKARARSQTRRPDADDAALVLELVERLIAELHPHATRMMVTLDADFDRELGLDSLELVELLLRVEDAFVIALPSRTLGTIGTPRDLLNAVRAARDRPVAAPPVAPASPLAGVATPTSAATLVEALRWHARATPDRLHVRLLDESGVEAELGYGDLYEAAASVASGLLRRDVAPGSTVAIMLPTSRAYFVTFAGVLLAGGVPVPIYPPASASQLTDHLQRHARILANAGTTMLVTVPEAVALGRLLRSHVETLRDVLVPEELASPLGGTLPVVEPQELALLQYTSGSTGHPKGVMLTHANLLANIRAMGQAAEVSGADTFVSWLPLYHDMGLIGAWLGSLYFGIPFIVMPPQVFLTRPSRWLRAIHEHGGTISAAPNFGYELCLRRVDESELEGVDLSSWRLAFNGAEPVSPETIERFAARFASAGFRREAMTPVYGLAESSVGVTFPPLKRGPLIDRVARDPFVRIGRALPAPPDDAHALRFVACGQPLRGHELRVVDRAGHELGDRDEGRIEFRGPSATSGYYRDADATRSLFDGEWLDTGDLGYVVDGELYVTGRVKDVIIRAGRNVHPDELEEAVGNLSGVRKGCVAVFASPDPSTGTERLVVLAETRKTDDEALSALRSEIVAVTVDLLGTPPDDVVLAPPRTVLKTSSGKIRRAASREVYEHGAVGAEPRRAWWQLARFWMGGATPRLRRLRRAASALAFAAYAWILLVAMVLPSMLLLMLIPRQQWRREYARGAVRTLARLTGTPMTTHGLDRLPSGPALVVANHPSWLDGFVLAAVLPATFRFVAGEVLTRRAVSGFILRRVGAEFVERSDRERGIADTERLVRLVRRGERLAMFPEGHLHRAPGLRPFHMGAFVVAAQAGIPVVPVAIRGTRSMLRPGHRFPRRGSVLLVIGDAIEPTGTDWAAAVELQRAARAEVLRTCNEPDLE